MEVLDLYVSKLEKTSIQKGLKCCDDESNIVYDEEYGFNTCTECGIVVNTVKEKPSYCKNVDFITKSYIPYHPKYKHLNRLHKWLNYSYREVKDRELTNFIEDLPIDNREVRNLAKILFIREYSKVSARANIRNGIIVYAIYKSHLILKIKIDIDDLFIMLKITYKHYNNGVKKIKDDRLLYPKNINNYLELIDKVIEKNYLISLYNDFVDKIKKFNSKSVILGIIYYILDNDGILVKKDFFNKFSISQNSINNIYTEIDNNNLIDNNILCRENEEINC